MKRLLVIALVLVSSLAGGQILGPIFGGKSAGTTGATSIPLFSPNPAYFFVGGSVSISLSCSTPGCYICYATSPTVPVPALGSCIAGTLYSTALSESSALTLNAVAG